MILNELAQWGAILFLATIGLGLTRQLGQFLISRKDELTYQGPEVGKSLPDTLLAEPERDALSAAIETSSPHRFGVVAVLSDRCLGCIGLVSQIESDGPPLGLPTLAFLDTSDVHPDFIQRVRAAFTIVCDDSRHARTQKAGITALKYI